MTRFGSEIFFVKLGVSNLYGKNKGCQNLFRKNKGSQNFELFWGKHSGRVFPIKNDHPLSHRKKSFYGRNILRKCEDRLKNELLAKTSAESGNQVTKNREERSKRFTLHYTDFKMNDYYDLKIYTRRFSVWKRFEYYRGVIWRQDKEAVSGSRASLSQHYH